MTYTHEEISSHEPGKGILGIVFVRVFIQEGQRVGSDHLELFRSGIDLSPDSVAV